MKTDFHSIAHWDASHRSVLVHINADSGWVFGMISGLHIEPEDDFAANIVFYSHLLSIHGTGPAGKCRLGEGGHGQKFKYKFVNEHPDVEKLRQAIAQKKLKTLEAQAETLKAQTESTTDELPPLHSELKEAAGSAVADGSSGPPKRVPAVRAARLSGADKGAVSEAS